MDLRKETINVELEALQTMEDTIEELTLHIVNILKDQRQKGFIEEEEYKKHTKLKEEYLAFLQEKRKG